MDNNMDNKNGERSAEVKQLNASAVLIDSKQSEVHREPSAIHKQSTVSSLFPVATSPGIYSASTDTLKPTASLAPSAVTLSGMHNTSVGAFKSIGSLNPSAAVLDASIISIGMAATLSPTTRTIVHKSAASINIRSPDVSRTLSVFQDGSATSSQGRRPAVGRPPADKSGYHTAHALTISHVVAMSTGIIVFCCLAYNRICLYCLGALGETESWQRPAQPWYEVAICFGPRLPAGVLRDRVTHTAAAPLSAVDSAATYRRLFGSLLQWTESAAGDLLQQPVTLVLDRLQQLQYDTGHDRIVSVTDMPFLFRYSLCRNFSFEVAGTTDAVQEDEYHRAEWDKGRRFVRHRLHMPDDSRAQLLDGVAASYADVYVYGAGEFSEHALVSELAAYRTDLRRSLTLRVTNERVDRLSTGHQPCRHEAAAGEQVNCRTWCLARALLRAGSCTMPWLDALVFNTTAVWPKLAEHGGELGPLGLYSAETAYPWMREFARHRPCRSAADFNASFADLAAVYLPNPVAPLEGALAHCVRRCPAACQLNRVTISSAGDELRPDDTTSEVIIELSVDVLVIHYWWLYEWWQLANHLAGLLVGLFGLHLLGLHDRLFGGVDWCARRAGLTLSSRTDTYDRRRRQVSQPAATVSPPEATAPAATAVERAAT